MSVISTGGFLHIALSIIFKRERLFGCMNRTIIISLMIPSKPQKLRLNPVYRWKNTEKSWMSREIQLREGLLHVSGRKRGAECRRANRLRQIQFQSRGRVDPDVSQLRLRHHEHRLRHHHGRLRLSIDDHRQGTHQRGSHAGYANWLEYMGFLGRRQGSPTGSAVGAVSAVRRRRLVVARAELLGPGVLEIPQRRGLSISFTYLGEFQPTKYRHRILSWMEFSWAIGVIIVALLAWAVIPLDFSYKAGVFTFSSWNLFVLTSSLPAFFVWLWLLTLPETPKFLAETGQRDILLKVLTRMFVENTGKTAEDFREKLATCGLPSISCLVAMSENGNAAKSDTSSKKVLTKLEKFHHLVVTSKAQVKMLARKPYVTRLLTVGVIMFGMTSTYYSLMTWFPELFQRFAYFEANYPDEFASVCTVSKKMDVASNLTVNINDTVDLYGCFTEIDTSVYVNSIWLGVACFPCAILLPLTVDYIGYQVYLLFTATVSCAVTIAFYFVKTSAQNLVLSCIFEAFTSINISVIFCILVEIFPTNLRVMATAITIFLGRLGSLFGNMLFGYLIDEYCSILIIVMAAQLFLAAALCWATPNRGKMRQIQNDFNDPS
uniref:Major facilitator superfamily (MFS) profile domain-containing protein n=1 Tax=Trichogramma kaykai TaxID=54128 RepID=A0ABD2WRF7_9HYME